MTPLLIHRDSKALPPRPPHALPEKSRANRTETVRPSRQVRSARGIGLPDDPLRITFMRRTTP